MDMAHAKYLLLLDGKRWLAPIPDNTHKVLDLACGTGKSSLKSVTELAGNSNHGNTVKLISRVGIWTIEFADENPSADVIAPGS